MTNNKDYENKDEIFLKREFFKYLSFWKIFLSSILVCLLIAFTYVRYTPKIYSSNAKIKILDKKENNLELPSAADLFSNSKINLENEIEILRSYPLINKVVKNLNLEIEVYAKGDVISSLIHHYPFDIDLIKKSAEIVEGEYEISLTGNVLKIFDLINDLEYEFDNLNTINVRNNLPFEIRKIDLEHWKRNAKESYLINIKTTSHVINKIKKNLNVSQLGKESDIIKLEYVSSNKFISELILNELIKEFNLDGIVDKQLIHKRTIDFVNNRYLFISTELDSIEKIKQNYKSDNSIVDITSNSNISLNQSILSDQKLFDNENQLSITKMMIDFVASAELELLPSNLGFSNTQINDLIEKFNLKILERKKIVSSAGQNNPSIILIDNLLIETKKNISVSLSNYQKQLKKINENLENKSFNFYNQLSNLPENEKILRSIERNQKVKEALYLFLLQKREDAQVSFAITEPSIKVVEYALSSNIPISPKSKFIYFSAFILGLILPIIVLYFIFLFDNKVHSREDLEKYSLNILGEIPFFDLPESEKVFTNPGDRSIISESFRMFMSNVRYLQKNDSSSNIILVTSSIKGEGKTLNALNLALSFSSVGKKVLLIGCDLRNPQLHKYINFNKSVPGLVDYLVDNKTKWKENILTPFDLQPLDILLSGPLPPNPLNLINNGNIDVLLKDARKTYDYIIIDSAPTLLVADTQSLINKSDILIYIARCNVTDNDVLSHIQKVSDESETNVGIILNGVGQKNSYGYSYGYRYGYGYNYKYSYNYGYGYGYNSDDE